MKKVKKSRRKSNRKVKKSQKNQKSQKKSKKFSQAYFELIYTSSSLGFLYHVNSYHFICSGAIEMFHIAGTYCSLYGNPSKDYINKRMFSQLNDTSCRISVINPHHSSSQDSSSHSSSDPALKFTIAFACIGAFFFIASLVILLLIWRRFKTVISVSYRDIKYS